MPVDVKQVAEESLEIMLRPILRFCLKHSIRIQQLLEIIKRVMVNLAAEELRKEQNSITHSRLNVMTGVHRAEVARIYKRGEQKEKGVNVIAKVIGQWQQDRRFTTKNGRPRVLRLEGMDSEFVLLITGVSTDLNPYTVLFELERIGAVKRTRNGVKLCSRLYIPRDIGDGFKLMAEDTEHLMEAVQENLLKDDTATPNLHIKTQYDNIPDSYLSEIREWFYREGSAFHQKARNYLSKFDRDVNSTQKTLPGRIRVTVGSFSRTEPFEEAPPEN